MAKKSRDEVIREVPEYVDDTIRRNRRGERLMTALLVAQYVGVPGVRRGRVGIRVPGFLDSETDPKLAERNKGVGLRNLGLPGRAGSA